MNRSTTTPPVRGTMRSPRFTLVEGEEDEDILLVQAPAHRPQSTFNIDIEDTGDDVLLDWEQYSKSRVFRCCGREFSLTPPDWWFKFSKRQRRCLLASAGCCLIFTLLLLILAAAAMAKQKFWQPRSMSSDSICQWNQWRLPSTTMPTRYNLTFDVQMQDPWRVKGQSDIDLVVSNPTRCIVIHTSNMDITNIFIDDIHSNARQRASTGGTIALFDQRYDQTTEQLTLEFESDIPQGHAALHLSFSYLLRDGMSGFYKSGYALRDGTREVVAATQFEANSARTAFPCFDEPAMKAVFAVEVITEKGLMVLSNMPAAAAHHHETQSDDIMTWHFQPTPPMSTYLLAIVIGNLVSVDRTVPPFVPGKGNMNSTMTGSGIASASGSMSFGGRRAFLGQIEQSDHNNRMKSGRVVSHGDETMGADRIEDSSNGLFTADQLIKPTNSWHDDVSRVYNTVRRKILHEDDEESHHHSNNNDIHMDHMHSSSMPGSTDGDEAFQQARHVSVWGTRDQIANLEYAADTAAAILPAYESALGVPYSLPKLDLVAIPDFSAGAMENWGLITYRQTALLVSPTSSLTDKIYVAKVVAHEMAHQWFGNLVTMAWWSDLWLNEGFASYIEYMGAHAAHAELSFYDRFYPDDVPYALLYDSKRASHAMSLESMAVNSTDKIESLFDPVEYERGASVLRMLRAWINRGNMSMVAGDNWEATVTAGGPSTDLFLHGIQRYLETFQYNATTPQQLWSAVSQSVGVELGPLTETWTHSQGYPVLSVSVDGKRNVWVQQAPFSLSEETQCDSLKALWWVPVAFVSSDGPTQAKWAELNACQSLRPLLALPKGGWVKVNAMQYGYYRVNYSPELWTALATAAAQKDVNGFPVLRGMDLAGLIDDSYALAKAGRVDIHPFLENIKALPSRLPTEYAPWSTALPYLYSIDRLVQCKEAWRRYVSVSILDTFIANASGPIALPVGGVTPSLDFSFVGNASGEGGGGDDDALKKVPVSLRLLRPMILKISGLFGNEKLIKEALVVLSSSPTKQATSFDPDLRAAIYQTAAHAASKPKDAFDKLKRLYLAASDADEKDRTLRALGFSPIAVPAALEFALTPDVRPQDVRMLVTTVAAWSSDTSTEETWKWFTENWDRLHLKLGGDDEASRRLGQILEGVASMLVDARMISEVDAEYEAHKDKQSEPGYAERAKESISANVLWKERHEESVCEWLQQQQQQGK